MLFFSSKHWLGIEKKRQNPRKVLAQIFLELAIGLEPTTTGLQNQGSTIELRQRVLAS